MLQVILVRSVQWSADSVEQLELLHFGVATARRAWAQKQAVINTWSPQELLVWLRSRG